jgi:uncharacterized membrane protein
LILSVVVSKYRAFEGCHRTAYHAILPLITIHLLRIFRANYIISAPFFACFALQRASKAKNGDYTTIKKNFKNFLTNFSRRLTKNFLNSIAM